MVCLNSHYRCWGLLTEKKTIKFSIGTHVQKHTASPLQTKYQHITCWILSLLMLIVGCFLFGFTYSARLLLAMSHEGLNLRDPCGIRGRTAGAGYDCGGCWTTRYWHGRLARWRKWRACDIGEAKEGLENELWRRWSNGRVGEWVVT